MENQMKHLNNSISDGNHNTNERACTETSVAQWELKLRRLQESALLYTEAYESDVELQKWCESALMEWVECEDT